MAREFSPLLRRTTFLLLAIAALAVEVASLEMRPVLESVGLASVWIVVAAVTARFLPAPADAHAKPPWWVFLLVVALAAAPFVVEPLRREWTGDGSPLEIQMVSGLRNVGLGMAACSGWLLCLRLACVASLFLTLFAVSLTNHPTVLALLGLYTAVGSVWLMLVYWGGLKSVFVSPEKIVVVEVQAGRLRLPWLSLSLLAVVLLSSVALALVGPRRVAFVLGEWMPTSGGTGDTDVYARHGIGDGPEETAGDNARAAGMVESEKMIEDNKNSLIDAVSDMFGPPHKPREDMEAMVAAGKVDIIKNHGPPPDNRRPSRDFDTSRKGPRNSRKPRSQDARGLFEIHGKTPLHVRVVAYGAYDAGENRWLEAGKPGGAFIEAEGGDWMRVLNVSERSAWYLADERHQLKTANMPSNLVPTPALLTRFRIQRVDRAHHYEWDYEGVLVLARRKRTPPGVVVNTVCRTVDPRRLPDTAFSRSPAVPPEPHQPAAPARDFENLAGASGRCSLTAEKIPESMRAELARLAGAWAGDKPRGWPQIEAVLNRLRTEYALDRDAPAPANHPVPVLWFLNESRRGPDYLFATAAAFLLNALDYRTRVCLGYYASPDAYDAESDHTPITDSDLHVWPEVRLQDGHWLVVEPTPGYAVLGPSLPLSERLLAMLGAAADWSWRHLLEVVLAFVGLIAAWVWRREIVDVVAVRLWLWFPGPSWRERVRSAVGILERRALWSGKARPGRRTVFSWLAGAAPRGADAELDRFLLLAQFAAYAPDPKPPMPEESAWATCRQVLRAWTLRRWRDTDTSLGAKS